MIEFQCSSASRKFLNLISATVGDCDEAVSVLFSEPKIPQFEEKQSPRALQVRFSALQRAENSSIHVVVSRVFNRVRVSVLFSEPKIPQLRMMCCDTAAVRRFSALQRAENSSISTSAGQASRPDRFQCSSASRKFLNSRPSHLRPSIFPTAMITLRHS